MVTTAEHTTLTRAQIRKIFKDFRKANKGRRFRGPSAEVARRADVSHVSVSLWLSGDLKSSANIAGHAQDVAQEILSAKGKEV